ncbi:MAG: DUF3857 domain-containing protein [Bacteroidota bacterium]
MKRFLSLILFIFSSLFCATPISAFAKQPMIRIGPAPGWITPVTPEYGPIPSGKAMQAGYYYLLFNIQERTGIQQRYDHLAVKVLNNEGVQSMADISVDFNPSYEKLLFHTLQVIRDGKVINKLNSNEIKVIQREVNLDQYMYDGMQTALINLKDIRINDIIEYAYSITGYNPIFGDHFSDYLQMEFSAPVRHLIRRVIVPSDHLFNFKYLNGAAQPVITSAGNEKTYLWEAKEIPSLTLDINTPYWYNPVKTVYMSDYASWADIATWGLDLFTVSDPEKKELERRIEGIICRKPADSVIVQAIRFVQDRIRYLGFEDGMNAHRPDKPNAVMNQLYGDCKSKSLLLAEILKLRGIDAWPILVNSNTGKVLGEKLPSPLAFNHCVTGFFAMGKIWYADPTISNQGGDLEHLFFPAYEFGLDLKTGTKSLTPLPTATYASTKVREQYTLDRIGAGATLKVTTIYKGGDADYQRSSIATTNPADITRQFQNFYSALFPTIKPICDVVVHDQRGGDNSLVMEEQYSIDSMWKRSNTNQKVLVCEFYPLSFATFFTGKKSPPRTMPYMLGYPIDYEHQTVVELPEEWTARDDAIDRGSEFFQYHHTIHYADRRLSIVHVYRTLKDFVPAKKVEPFLAALQEVSDHLTYRLTYDESLAGGKQVSWFSWIVTLIVVAVSSFFARKIYLKPFTPAYSPGFQTRQIGGWLIYFAFVITLTPVRMTWQLFFGVDFFNSQIWDMFVDMDGTLRNFVTAMIIFFELVLNMALLVFSILAAIMFYQRRAGFPRFYTLLVIAITVVQVSDTLLVAWLNITPATEQSNMKDFRQIITWIIYAGIAIRYFVVSRRVRETFTEPSAIFPAEPSEENPENASDDTPTESGLQSE